MVMNLRLVVFVIVVLRLMEMIGMIIAAALSGSSAGAQRRICIESVGCRIEYLDLSISTWTYAGASALLKCRIFLLTVEVLLLAFSIGTFIYCLSYGRRFVWEWYFCATSSLCCLIGCGIEAWYSSYAFWNVRVSSWIAASIFLCVTSILFAIDLICTWIEMRQTHEHDQPHDTTDLTDDGLTMQGMELPHRTRREARTFHIMMKRSENNTRLRGGRDIL